MRWVSESVRAAECEESGVVVMLCLQQLCVELCLPEALGDRRFWREESAQRSLMQGKSEPHHVTAHSHAFHARHVNCWIDLPRLRRCSRILFRVWETRQYYTM